VSLFKKLSRSVLWRHILVEVLMRWGRISVKMYTFCLIVGVSGCLFVVEAAAAGIQVHTHWIFGMALSDDAVDDSIILSSP
jgi:hypothetical protein